MTNFIINCQTDGDGYYHIHRTNCSYRPQSNYKYCNGTITDAARVLGVSQNKIKKYSHCM